MKLSDKEKRQTLKNLIIQLESTNSVREKVQIAKKIELIASGENGESGKATVSNT